MIERIKKQDKKLSRKALKEKLDKLMSIEELEFSLKPIRTIADVGSSFSLVNNSTVDPKDEAVKLYVTNFGDVIFMDKE